VKAKRNNFVEVFRDVAEPILIRHPQLRFDWKNHPKAKAYTLRILKNSPTGFDVGVEVQTYALYPFAGDWRGAPWDVTTPDTTLIAMCNYSLGLLRSLLSTDTRLKARCAGGRPYKWAVEIAGPSGWKMHEASLKVIFFNYWATRSEQFFQNDQLPPLGFATGTTTLNSFETTWT